MDACPYSCAARSYDLAVVGASSEHNIVFLMAAFDVAPLACWHCKRVFGEFTNSVCCPIMFDALLESLFPQINKI